MVYVLLGTIAYEGNTLLGVYATCSEAEAAYDQYCVEHTAFDGYDILRVEVGAAAEWRW